VGVLDSCPTTEKAAVSPLNTSMLNLETYCDISADMPSLTSQTQPTPVRIAFSITHWEGSGDAQ